MTIGADALVFRAGARTILQDLSFEWGTGLLVITGGNGSGKSTLLRCLSSSIRATGGTVRWNGVPIDAQLTAYRQALGYAPQGRHLPSRLRAAEFLETCARLKRLRTRSMRAETEAALADVGLEAYADAPLESLSGGSLRKLLTAQALLGTPSVLLLDEPTSEVDAAGSRRIWAALKAHAEQAAVIVATHDLELALGQADGHAEMAEGRLSPIRVPESA
jgi:ABC-2 type transport system ATP-binding protein